MKTKLLPYCSSAILLALNLSTICHAQAVSRVTITHVKPEMIN